MANLSKQGGLQLDDTIHVDGTGDSYVMGRLGIGTITPADKLDVFGGNIATDNYLKIKS